MAQGPGKNHKDEKARLGERSYPEGLEKIF
jgi:hypothetical protein